MNYVCSILITLIGASCCAAGELNVAIADRLGILPTPKEIALSGEKIDLAGWKIAVAEKPRQKWPDVCHDYVDLNVAASEINDRLAELGAAPLTAVGQPEAGGKTILVCVDPALAAIKDREQGYVIEASSQGVRLTGSDPLGALYAAVTLRYLIVKEQGGTVLLAGKVLDWPDFKLRRCVQLKQWWGRGCPDLTEDEAKWDQVAKGYLEAQKPAIDGAFRLKINGAELKRFRPRKGEGDTEKLWRCRAVSLKKVADYCHARGIQCEDVTFADVKDYLSEVQRNEYKRGNHGDCYSWALKDAHARRAEEFARRIADVGLDYIAVHAVDSGEYADPELWSKRGAADRTMYRDDERWKASSEQWQLYFDAFRKARPSLKFESVPMPYFAQFTDPDFWHKWHDLKMPYPCAGWNLGKGLNSKEEADKCCAELTSYNQKLAAALPAPIYLGWREVDRAALKRICDIYRGHPLNIWFYPAHSAGWRAPFEPQIRFAKSFLFEDRRDAVYVEAVSDLALPATAEYVWNASAVPDGSAEFDTFKIAYETEGRNVSEYQKKSVLPRACKMLLGSEWQPFVEALAQNLSITYVVNPQDVARKGREGFDEPNKYVAEQADAFRRLRPKFEAALSKVEEGKATGLLGNDLRKSTEYPTFTRYCAMYLAACDLAELQGARVAAEKALKAGDKAKAAEIAGTALKELPERASRLTKNLAKAAGAGVASFPLPEKFDRNEWESALAKLSR